MFTCIYIDICLHIYIYVYMYVCIYVYMYVCMYVCMYVYNKHGISQRDTRGNDDLWRQQTHSTHALHILGSIAASDLQKYGRPPRVKRPAVTWSLDNRI